MKDRKRNSESPATRWRAFTLVELLVVIGIFAVLLGILLPSLNRARASAQRVACSSNLRQMGLGLLMYTNDFKQHLPWIVEPLWDTDGTKNFAGDPFNAVANPFSLPVVLKPYLGESKVYSCPSAILGYPAVDSGMNYRISSANNRDGQARTEEFLLSPLQYDYSFKFLNYRVHRLRYAELVPVGGFPTLQLLRGIGPFYLVRDLVSEALVPPHDRYNKSRAFNQLMLDFSVVTERDTTVGLTYP